MPVVAFGGGAAGGVSVSGDDHLVVSVEQAGLLLGEGGAERGDHGHQCLDFQSGTPPLTQIIWHPPTHDYLRNGTTMLFAALEVATGKVTDQCDDRHGKAEFGDFLRKVAKAYPGEELHVVVDNYHTHKNAEIKAWPSRNPRITLHFTPTSGSWLNMVEVFFGIITSPAIRRGSCDSVGQPATAIRAFFEGWNDCGHRFTWAKTAGEIMPHATRKRDSAARH